MATIGYWICFPLAALLRLFYGMTSSYGVSLILFTLAIKLILLPFQMKSKKSMMRMNRMSGRIQEIQKRYAKNQEKMGEEMQKLYAEEGVNPMSGCLWNLLPMPILFALYYVIREPIVFFMNFGSRAAGKEVLSAAKKLISNAGITLSGSRAYEQIEISNIINSKFPSFAAKHSGWVNVDYHFLHLDLSRLPNEAFSMLKTGVTWTAIGLILIPILSAVFQVLMMKFSMKGQPNAGASAVSNKMMTWVMPLFSLWIGFTLPAALGVYWIAQSAFSAVQEALLGKFYNGKLEEEENERQLQIEERRRQRQEEAKRVQEEQRKLTAKQQAASKKKAVRTSSSKKKRSSTTENGRVGDRPYAKGRAFSDEHYLHTSDGDEK
jgi:YidC/Oxa1 family membrane protein insertase